MNSEEAFLMMQLAIQRQQAAELRKQPVSRRTRRELLILMVERGPWYERVWLPLLRLVHWLARGADARQERAA